MKKRDALVLTDEQIDHVLDLRDQGEGWRGVGAALGVGFSALRLALARQGYGHLLAYRPPPAPKPAKLPKPRPVGQFALTGGRWVHSRGIARWVTPEPVAA